MDYLIPTVISVIPVPSVYNISALIASAWIVMINIYTYMVDRGTKMSGGVRKVEGTQRCSWA